MNPLAVTGVHLALARPAPSPNNTDPNGTEGDYATLLNAESATDGHVERGNATIGFDSGASAHRVLLEVGDVAAAARLLNRRGLLLDGDGDTRSAPTEPFGITPSRTGGEPNGDHDGTVQDIIGIDHLVFMCAGRDRALAFFGATLGLDLRLDRLVADRVHQLFFRAGDLVFEVVANDSGQPLPDEQASDSDDLIELWGVAWHAPDIERTHARLVSGGLTVTPIRPGRKPGTRILTVSEHSLGTRTVVIGPG